MKLHKLYEDKKLSRQQMIDWCKNNIIDFSEFDEHAHREKYIIDALAQVVYLESQDIETYIETADTELPFEINCKASFTITAPNLKSFKNFPSGFSSVFPSSFGFDNCGSLDFGYFYYPQKDNIRVLFIDNITNNTNPQLLNKNQKWGVLYYEDTTFVDIKSYTHLNTIKRLLLYPLIPLQNVSHIFDTKIEHIKVCQGNVTQYSYNESQILNTLINKYIKLGKDHVMDMAIELADNGFEDEV